MCPGVGTRFFIGGTPACPNSGGTITTLLSDVALADRTTGHTATVTQGVGAIVRAGVVVSLASPVAPTSFRITFQYRDSPTLQVFGWNGSTWVSAVTAPATAPAVGGNVLAWWDYNGTGTGVSYQCFLIMFTDGVVDDLSAPFLNITDVRLYNGATLLN